MVSSILKDRIGFWNGKNQELKMMLGLRWRPLLLTLGLIANISKSDFSYAPLTNFTGLQIVYNIKA